MNETENAVAVVTVPEVLELERTVTAAGCETVTARTLIESFRPIFAEVHKLIEKAKSAPVITDATQLTEMKLVREIRLDLAAERIKGDKLRAKLKEDSLRRGNAIQGVYNLLKFMVEPLEESLLESEKFAERAEAARKALLKAERETALKPYVADASFYQLGDMPKAQWETLLDGVRTAHEVKLAAAAQAEADRLAKEKADAEERERVRLENDRLKREAVLLEAAAKAEREKARKDRESFEAKAKADADAAAEKARSEKAEIEAQAKAESERVAIIARREREAIEAQALKERTARLKVEAEAKALLKAATEKLAAEALAAKKAAAAPDRVKLEAIARLLREIRFPDTATPSGGSAMGELKLRLADLSTWIEKKAGAL